MKTALLAVFLALTTLPALADDRADCESGAVDPDRRIAACSARLKTGKLDRTNQAIVYTNLGLGYRSKGDLDRAIADFNQAIKLKPNLADPYNNRGLAYGAQGNLDLAIADFNQASKLRPDRAEPYYNRGLAYQAKGDLDRAVADYSEAITLKPDYADAYNHRGLARSATGDLDHAIADYTLAIKLKPDSAYVYGSRGRALLYTGSPSAAAADFGSMLSLNPSYAYALLWLAIAEARAGMPASIEKQAGSRDLKEWPGPVIAAWTMDDTAGARTAMIEAAGNNDQLCEAWFYRGEYDLAHTPAQSALPASAEEAFRRALALCPKTFVEYEGAQAELRRFGKP